MIPNSAPGEVRFADFRYDPGTRTLRQGEATIGLTRQPAAVLELLLLRAGEVISREELRRHLWGDRSVDVESGLNFCLHQVRKALDDDHRQPRFIRTVPGQGYQFISPVSTDSIPPVVRPARARQLAMLAAVAVALVWADTPSNQGERGPVTIGPEVEAVSTAVQDRPLAARLAATVAGRLEAWRPAAGIPATHQLRVAIDRLSDSTVEIQYSIRPLDRHIERTEGRMRGPAADQRLMSLAAGQIVRAVSRLESGADDWPDIPGAVVSRQRIERAASIHE